MVWKATIGTNDFTIVFGPATIGPNGFTMVFGLVTIAPDGFSMVFNALVKRWNGNDPSLWSWRHIKVRTHTAGEKVW